MLALEKILRSVQKQIKKIVRYWLRMKKPFVKLPMFKLLIHGKTQKFQA